MFWKDKKVGDLQGAKHRYAYKSRNMIIRTNLENKQYGDPYIDLHF